MQNWRCWAVLIRSEELMCWMITTYLYGQIRADDHRAYKILLAHRITLANLMYRPIHI